MEPKIDQAREVIIKAFTGFDTFSQEQANEFAFHLTDWIDDLPRFVEFIENPSKLSNDEIQKLVIAFLAHVPYHLKEASEMLFDTERKGSETQSGGNLETGGNA
jgi:hypothetical protein